MNPRKWVKKSESQVGELDQLKLKTVILHDNRDVEVYMTQLDGFIAAKLFQLVELGGARLDELRMA